jgi:hypothetical protein
MKGIKQRKKHGDGWGYELNDSQLNFERLMI